MTHGSLYSGIGGWLLAALWAGIENIFTVEIDKFCNKILDKHFPGTDRNYDIKETDFKKYVGTIDILSTSDPCQPFSFAGKRGGKEDDRYLWPQTIRIIREIKPSYVVFENVIGFINMAFETVASDLEAEGYTVESFIIPACAVGAWHRRNRLWVIAYSNEQHDNISGFSSGRVSQLKASKIFRDFKDVSNTDSIRNTKGGKKHETEFINKNGKEGRNAPNPNSTGLSSQREQKRISKKERETCSSIKRGSLLGEEWITEGWESESGICRVANGIPNRVHRLKSLGNSIVPQIAYIIFEAIKQYEINRNDT